MEDFLSVADLSESELSNLLNEASQLKKAGWVRYLENKVLGLLFEKPSLRTRVSFEVAMRQLGGQVLYLSPAEIGLGKRESVPDVARVLARYVDIIAARTFEHRTVDELAKYSRVPVVNALSDQEHPCQALADLLTIKEKKGTLAGLTLAYIGDGNNVANSLLLACTLSGINFRIANPPGYDIPEKIMSMAKKFASKNNSTVNTLNEPSQAAADADVLYTDVWTSMGQEEEAQERKRVFASYQLNRNLLAMAKKDAIIMHPLPAHHGEEIEAGLTDLPQSVVFDEAENRMHVQKAILNLLLKKNLS